MITAANSGFNQRIAGFGYLSYIGGDAIISSEPSIDYGGRNTSSEVVFLDETTTQPLITDQPSQEADETHILTVGHLEKAWKWSLKGNHSYDLSLEAAKPLLWRPEQAADNGLVISTKNNTWVDIIFVAEADASSVQPSHPIHKHSNPAYVIVSLILRLRPNIPNVLTTIDRDRALEHSIGHLSKRLRRPLRKIST